MQPLLFEHFPGQGRLADDFGKDGDVVSVPEMVPDVPQLEFAHHADFVNAAPAQAVVEEGPVEILIFRLLRVNAGIQGYFFQGVGYSAGLDISQTADLFGRAEYVTSCGDLL